VCNGKFSFQIRERTARIGIKVLISIPQEKKGIYKLLKKKVIFKIIEVQISNPVPRMKQKRLTGCGKDKDLPPKTR